MTYAAAEEPRVQQQDKSAQDNVHEAAAWSYPVPIDEFLLDRVELTGSSSVDLDYDGPSIALCTAGSVTLTDAAGETVTATPGQAVWLPASEDLVTAAAESDSADLFVARA